MRRVLAVCLCLSACGSNTVTIDTIPSSRQPPDKAYIIPIAAQDWEAVCFEAPLGDPFNRFWCASVKDLRLFVTRRKQAN